MRLALLTAVLTGMVWPASAQYPPAPVTWDQASTLSPELLSELVFRQLGARMTAVTRPSNHYAVSLPAGLTTLVFAGAPHATPTVGLCAAIRAEIEFQLPPSPSFSGPGSDTPAQARLVRAAEVYKVTGEVEPYAEVSEARAAEEDGRCAEAGPVIPASRGDHGQPYYFSFQGEADPDLALLVLQQAIDEAQRGIYRTISCAAPARGQPAWAECRTPPALLGGLSLANLVDLQIGPAAISGDRHLIRARFLVRGAPRAALYWSVSVEADISRPPNEAPAIERLGRTLIARTGVPAYDYD